MADGDVQWKFFADANAAERAIASLEKKYDDLENKIKGVSRATKKQVDEGSQGFAGMAAEVGKFAAGMVGVTTVAGAATAGIKAIAAEWRNVIDLQQKAAQTQLSYAESFDQALLNSGGMKAADLQSMIDRISKQTNASPGRIANVLSTSFSARGNLPMAEMENAVVQSLMLSRNIPSLTPPLVGAALDLQKVFGGATSEDALGFLLASGASSRVADPGQLAANIGPAITGVSRTGATAQQSAALVAAFTQAAADPTGASSGTASIAFARQLQEALPNLPDLESRIKAMQNDPAVRQKFLGGKFTLEKKFLGPAESLLAGGDVSGLFQNALQQIPNIEAGDALFRQQVQQLGRTPVAGVAETSESLKTRAANILLGDRQRGMQGVLGTDLPELEQASGMSALQQMVGARTRETFGALGVGPEKSAAVGAAAQDLLALVLPGGGKIGGGSDVLSALQEIAANTRKSFNREAQSE